MTVKTKNKKYKTVMVFGVFDGLHPGHIFFLKQAKEMGESLIAVAAQDISVFRLKDRFPRFSLGERMQKLQSLGFVDRVVAGDEEEEKWEVLEKFKPDLIALGHDQLDLKRVLQNKKKVADIDLIVLKQQLS